MDEERGKSLSILKKFGRRSINLLRCHTIFIFGTLKSLTFRFFKKLYFPIYSKNLSLTFKSLQMKKITLIFTVITLFIELPVLSQVTVSLGTYTGEGSTNVLLSTSTTSNRYSRTISIYTEAEITAAGGMAGVISKLAWDKRGTGEYTTADAYIKVFLKHVTNDNWASVPDWDTEVVGATEVFTSATYSIPTGTGWKEVDFTTPFPWNGTDNIAVFVEWDRSSAPTSSIFWARSTTIDANATRVGSSSLEDLVLLINDNRPLLQLTIDDAGGGCIDPTITEVTGPGTICEGETATLTATHNGETLNWYDAEVGGTLLGSGSPFVTDPVTSTTSFWAEAVNTGGVGTPQTGGARVAPSSNTASEVLAASNPWGLAFDANEDFIINSVDVFLADDVAGDIIMQLKDTNLNVIDQVTIAAPAGNSTNPVQFTLDLNFFVPAGTNYNLVADTGPVVMVREFSSGHPGFPYPIGTLGTVTNGTINDNDSNPTVYYFFYNWTTTPSEGVCLSDREEVVVEVTPSPDAPIGISPQQYIEGETLADLDVTGDNLTWYSDAGGTIEIPDTTPLVDGTTYYVSQTVDGCESPLLSILVELVLSVDDVNFENLAYYPNPVKSLVNISNSEPIRSITLVNMLGQVVNTVTVGDTSVKMDLSNLNTGTYFAQIVLEDASTATIRLIKE